VNDGELDGTLSVKILMRIPPSFEKESLSGMWTLWVKRMQN